MSLSTDLPFAASARWPVAGDYDAVVAGAGPAGIAAAVAAARLGASTLLVDKAPCPGGLVTHANLPHFMGLGMAGRQIVRGIADEFVRRLDRFGAARLQRGGELLDGPVGERPLDCDVITTDHPFRVVAYRMLAEAGVHVLCYSGVIAALVEGRRLSAVAIDRIEGPALVRGKAFVDCTGDAHLLARSGARTVTAPPDVAMTKTQVFDMAGVRDFSRKCAADRFCELRAQEKVPVAVQDYFMGYGAIDPGVVHMNFTAVTGDALSSADMTRMDAELREQVTAAVDWFKREFPGFEDAWLARNAEMVGVRAGRVGVGVQTITQKHIDDDSPVSEPIALGIRRYGDHGLRGFHSPWQKPISGARPIPWRSLIAADLDNVAMAGRCLSIEPKVLTCVRYIAQCMATGQAAGITAAQAAARGLPMNELDYGGVRRALEQAGAVLE